MPGASAPFAPLSARHRTLQTRACVNQPYKKQDR